MPPAAVTIPQAFAFALEQFQAGLRDTADSVCQQILAVQPAHPGAWHLRGLIAGRAGQHAAAAEHLARAVALLPEVVEYRLDLAQARQCSGQWAAAAEEWRAVLRVDPRQPGPHYELGVTLGHVGAIDPRVTVTQTGFPARGDGNDTH